MNGPQKTENGRSLAILSTLTVRVESNFEVSIRLFRIKIRLSVENPKISGIQPSYQQNFLGTQKPSHLNNDVIL